MKQFIHFAASTFLVAASTTFAQSINEGSTVEAGMNVSSTGDRYWTAPVRDSATIRAAQRALRTEGYDAGPADGTLHSKTVQAVKRLQQDRELEATGVLDRRTVAALGIDVTGG